MHLYRRKLLKAIGAAMPLAMAAGAGLLKAGSAFAAVWNKTGFDAKTATDEDGRFGWSRDVVRIVTNLRVSTRGV